MELQQIARHSYYQTNVNKLLSIFLVFAVSLSSVGMSVSQHFCTMSKKEIEQSKCDMCSSEKHGSDKKPGSDGKPGKKSCCSNESIHLRLDTDATNVASQTAPQPLIATALFVLVHQAEQMVEVSSSPYCSTFDLNSFPLTEEYTVLRV